MIKPYFPNTTDQQAAWYLNFGTMFTATRATRLGFSTTERTDLLARFELAYRALSEIRALALSTEEVINSWIKTLLYAEDGSPQPPAPTMPVWPSDIPPTVPSGIDEFRQRTVQQIKSNPGYDQAVDGPELKIDPTGSPFDPDAWQAVVRDIRCTGPSEVRLKLAMANGAINGNEVRSRLRGQATWKVLGRFTRAEVIDRTAVAVPGQSEDREYQVQSLKADQLIGTPSDIESVTVQG